MKSIQFVVFFTVFFGIYFLINLYLFKHGLRSIPAGSPFAKYFTITFLVLSFSFVVGSVLDRIWYSGLSHLINWIGTFWLAFMLYFLIYALLADIFMLVWKLIPNAGDFAIQNKFIMFRTALVLISLIVLSGYFNAINPKVRHMQLEFDKDLEKPVEHRIAFVSDIHLGSQIGARYLSKIVRLINEQKPDIILLAGDIINDNMMAVEKKELGKILQKLHALKGVYGITGNHEYIGNSKRAVHYLSQFGIEFLRDSFVEIDHSLIIAGREDKDKSRFEGTKETALANIIGNKHSSVILLDHQPARIEEAIANQVDLLICGHTHHGQLWPLNYITKSVYKLSWGYKKFKDTHVYVSCGVGTWGPRVRIGNRPEIVTLDMKIN